MARSVYFDHCAATPLHTAVAEVMAATAADCWANPASVHRPGQRARAQLDRARVAIARLVGLSRRDVTLTSSGTEANNMALQHPYAGDSAAVGGLVVARIEHPSVLRTAEALQRRGVAVAWVEAREDGVADAAGFKAALDEVGEVALVSLQAVNHETGVVQPVQDVAELAHARGALIHVDAVQAAGKLPHEAWQGADLVTVSSHKLRGPKGMGALITRPGVRLQALLFGGGQEGGIRPGTQDATVAAGFAVAAELALDAPARFARVGALRDALEAKLEALAIELDIELQRNGTAPRSPHVSNLSWRGMRGDELCAALDLEGVAASSGAACSAGSAEPSPVVLAMVGARRAGAAVRLSLGEDNSEDDVTLAVAAMRRVLQRGR